MTAVDFHSAVKLATEPDKSLPGGSRIEGIELNHLLTAAIKDFDAVAPGAVVLAGRDGSLFNLVDHGVPDLRTASAIESTIAELAAEIPWRTMGEWLSDGEGRCEPLNRDSSPKRLRHALDRLLEQLRERKFALRVSNDDPQGSAESRVHTSVAGSASNRDSRGWR